MSSYNIFALPLSPNAEMHSKTYVEIFSVEYQVFFLSCWCFNAFNLLDQALTQAWQIPKVKTKIHQYD